VEDAGFAGLLAAQYERDLLNATEIVLAPRRYRRSERILDGTARPRRVRRVGGSTGRAAAGALRIANTVGAALANRRVLADESTGPLLTGALLLAALSVAGVLWPRVIAWPLAALGGWLALNLGVRGWRQLKRRQHKPGDTLR